jgi:branched-chain amino acid transport system permease protein
LSNPSSAARESERSGLGRVAGVFGAKGLNRYQVGVLAIALLGLVTIPFWGYGFLYVLALANIWAIFAMSWDIISGHTGYISFGHSLLSGAAAYTTAMIVFNVDPNASIAITFPLSVLAAFVVGMLFALPSLRLRGPYFSLLTFVSVLIAVKLIFVFSAYTNSELGISAVPVISYNNFVLYYTTLVPMLLIAAVLVFISRSDVGLVLSAIRENEPAVEAAGLDTTKFKIGAFAISAIPMGIGGALLAHYYGNVSPATVLVVDRSIEMIAMAAIGGMGSILGPLAGAYLLVYLRDSLFLALFSPNVRWVALWTVVLILLILAPNGAFRRFWGFLGSLGPDRRLRREPGRALSRFRSAASSEGGEEE